MRVYLKVALIAGICLSSFAFPGFSRCDDLKTDCGRLKKILDQYAHNLSYKHMSNAHYDPETREKELLEEIKGLKLNKALTANIDSLLGQMKQCHPNQVMSAAYGVKGFFTDLNFIMKTDADLRKRCEGLVSWSEMVCSCGVGIPIGLTLPCCVRVTSTDAKNG